MKKLRVLFLAVVLAGAMTGCLSTSKDSKVDTKVEEKDTSSDSAGKEKEKETQEETEESQPQATTGAKFRETAAVYVSDDAAAVLENLDTDYTKIAWGVIYTPSEDEGPIISIAPYFDGENYFIVIGVTNLYDKDIKFEASGYAKDAQDVNVGNIDIKIGNIGAGGDTAIYCAPCEAGSTGAIHWDGMSFEESKSQRVNWESDWALGQAEDGSIGINYMIDGEEEMSAVKVSALVLDEDGFIIGFGESDDAKIDGNTAIGAIDFHTKEFNGTVADGALFANPVKK